MQPKLISSAPVLLTKDVVTAANYYRDKLGFSYERFWGDPPGFCILWRGKCHLMLSQVDDPALIRPHHSHSHGLWNVYFWVDDVTTLNAEFKESGAVFSYDLCDQPYGCREIGIRDLDGHDIAFGQDLT